MVKQAFLIVGGEGTRLRPLTYEAPKPLIKVKGVPIAEHVLLHLKDNGITDFVLSVKYMKERVKAYFGDGSKWGIKIDYVEEDEPLGTAGALNLANGMMDDRFLMLNGDALSKIDVGGLEEFHEKNGGLASIALVEVEDPSPFGVARMDGDRIAEFVEKPKREEAPSNLINAGFYLLEKEVIDYVPKGKAMMEYEVFPKLAAEGKLYGYRYSGPWFDIGTHESLKKANLEWE